MVHDPYWDLENEPVPPPFDASKTALLIIDMQNMCAHPDGWMGRLCRDQGKPDHLKERFDFMTEITPNLQKLLVFCRETGVEVFHVRIAFRTNTGRNGKRALLNRMEETPLVPMDFDIIDAITPLPGEIVIDKTSVSTFNSTAIDQILRNMGCDRVWTAGCVTEGCVELTTRDAADRGYWTTIVTDCCVELTARDAADRGFYVTLVSDGLASSTHAAHVDAIQRMTDGGLIKLRSVDDLCAQIAAAQVTKAA